MWYENVWARYSAVIMPTELSTPPFNHCSGVPTRSTSPSTSHPPSSMIHNRFRTFQRTVPPTNRIQHAQVIYTRLQHVNIGWLQSRTSRCANGCNVLVIFASGSCQETEDTGHFRIILNSNGVKDFLLLNVWRGTFNKDDLRCDQFCRPVTKLRPRSPFTWCRVTSIIICTLALWHQGT